MALVIMRQRQLHPFPHLSRPTSKPQDTGASHRPLGRILRLRVDMVPVGRVGRAVSVRSGVEGHGPRLGERPIKVVSRVLVPVADA